MTVRQYGAFMAKGLKKDMGISYPSMKEVTFGSPVLVPAGLQSTPQIEIEIDAEDFPTFSLDPLGVDYVLVLHVYGTSGGTPMGAFTSVTLGRSIDDGSISNITASVLAGSTLWAGSWFMNCSAVNAQPGRNIKVYVYTASSTTLDIVYYAYSLLPTRIGFSNCTLIRDLAFEYEASDVPPMATTTTFANGAIIFNSGVLSSNKFTSSTLIPIGSPKERRLAFPLFGNFPDTTRMFYLKQGDSGGLSDSSSFNSHTSAVQFAGQMIPTRISGTPVEESESFM
jgi:hypothetical protein